MNGTATRFLRLGMSLSGLVVLGWVLTGHAARPAKHGTPLTTDWSHRHLIFSHPSSADQLARVAEDPRYWQQILRRERALMADLDRNIFGSYTVKYTGKYLRRDWSHDL